MLIVDVVTPRKMGVTSGKSAYIREKRGFDEQSRTQSPDVVGIHGRGMSGGGGAGI